jgi:outer membrane protein OmpA-like peptidoglycan-associated protein
MKIRSILLGAAAAVVLTGAANAGYDRDGWYVGLEGGYVAVNHFETGLNELHFDGGMALLGTAGYALSDSNWRLEGEVGYRQNEAPAVFASFLTTSRGGTRVITTLTTPELVEYTYMANAVYDFRFSGEKFGFSLGAGIGMDNARLDLGGTGLTFEDWSVAAQGIAGATYRLGNHWDLTANYRYLVTAPTKFDLASAGIEENIRKHTFTIGLRYGYNEPPVEAAPPPPPPPPPKQFIVFFGFNKCNITAEADAVLSEAAAAAKSSGAAAVRVVGHTDTSGSNAYNQKLSECRANAVKTNLVGKGIGEGAISTSGKGEGELMVQTGDGVKEPQNRRATVDMN